MNVKVRKKQLIEERILRSPSLDKGRRTVLYSVLILALLRIALFIIELSYVSAGGVKISVLSHILLLPMLFILYMIYDGNKGISSVPAISAIVRAIVYFSTVHDEVIEAGLGLYTGLFLGVMLLQFAMSVLVSAATVCQAYFKEREAINLQLRKEMLGGGR